MHKRYGIFLIVLAVALAHLGVLVALNQVKARREAGAYAAVAVSALPASQVKYGDTRVRLGESPAPLELPALPAPAVNLPIRFLPVPTPAMEGAGITAEREVKDQGLSPSGAFLSRRRPVGFEAAAGPGKGLLKGHEGLARHVQQMTRMGLDVVFVFDSTESMVGVLSEVKEKIKLMMRILAELTPGFRVGMVAYRDYAAQYVTKPLPLTNDLTEVYNYIEAAKVGMGYKSAEDVGKEDIEWSEAVYAGIEKAVNSQWRPTARKVIILIGDAPPHPEELEQTLALVRSFWKGGKGIVYTIFTPVEIHRKGTAVDLFNPKVQRLFTKQEMEFLLKRDQKKRPDEKEETSQKVEEAFRSIALNGGGDCVRLSDEKEIVREMLRAALGRQWKGDVDEIYNVMKGTGAR